mmetsp:Transcript_53075/g.99451  ORF Transcript_53075/g.99451 Transcript_53075/m.99451 type:complete len:729 (-) Transcript_53075:331-2517(-)
MDSAEDRVPCEDFATCGVAQFQNRQFAKNVKQQDSYFVVEDIGATFGVRPANRERVALYGVADGHGEFGEVSANFLRRNLPPQLAQSQHFAAGRLKEAFLEAFAQTELLQQSSGLPLWASGACMLAVAVSATLLVIANCGDCRCVLAESGTAQDLSNDHNVESALPEEIQRVLNCGGTITPDKRVTAPGAPGRLATTRSLGDYWAKPQGPQEGHIISGMPEIRTLQRSPSQQYLIIASDGIFGFMSSQDVVTLCISAAQQVAPQSPLSRLAHTVVCTAVNARRSDDNCTCLVIDLNRVEASFAATPSPQGPPMPMLPNYPPAAMGYPRPPFEPPYNGGYPQPPMEGYPSPQGHHPHTMGSQFGGGRPQLPAGSRVGSTAGGSPGKAPSLPGMESGYDDPISPKDDSDISLSSIVAPDEICWCPWCWRQNRNGEPENVVLGSFEKWRLHMHDQHFDKLGGSAYGADEIMPCYWCCRPCVTKKGQNRVANCLPFWGSHERVCKENPNKPSGFGGSSRAPRSVAEESCQSQSSSDFRGGHMMEGRELRELQELRELRDLQRGLGAKRGQGAGRQERMRSSHPDEYPDSPQSRFSRSASPMMDSSMRQRNGNVAQGSSLHGAGGRVGRASPQRRSPPSPQHQQVSLSPQRRGASRRARDEVCGTCGASFTADAEFCRKCGAKRPYAATKGRNDESFQSQRYSQTGRMESRGSPKDSVEASIAGGRPQRRRAL